MQDYYQPYNEIGFDFKTSLTKEQAVLAMLGWKSKHFYEISEEEVDYQYRDHRGEIEDFGLEEPSLFSILYEIKVDADSAYLEAKYNNPEDVDVKKEEIKKSHALIDTAYRFYCNIDDELAKGESSELRVTETLHISIGSLAKWALKEYQIELLPTEITTFKDLNRSQEEIEDSLQIELDPDGAEQFHITHALLVEVFASMVPDCMRGNKEVNVSQLIKILGENTEMAAYSGQGKSTLSTLYPKILAIKNKTYQKELESLRTTTLQNQRINLAFLVEEYVRLDNSRGDAAVIDDETVSEIAEHLADLGKGLSGQSQKLIESRIKVAMDVKNDPNSMRA